MRADSYTTGFLSQLARTVVNTQLRFSWVCLSFNIFPSVRREMFIGELDQFPDRC